MVSCNGTGKLIIHFEFWKYDIIGMCQLLPPKSKVWCPFHVHINELQNSRMLEVSEGHGPDSFPPCGRVGRVPDHGFRGFGFDPRA